MDSTLSTLPKLNPEEYCVLCWIYQNQINACPLDYDKIPFWHQATALVLHQKKFINISPIDNTKIKHLTCNSTTIKALINNQICPSYNESKTFTFTVQSMYDNIHLLETYHINAYNINQAFDYLATKLKELVANPVFWQNHSIKKCLIPALPYELDLGTLQLVRVPSVKIDKLC